MDAEASLGDEVLALVEALADGVGVGSGLRIFLLSEWSTTIPIETEEKLT